jgi:molybdate transport system substrate-binding protein
MKAFAGSLALVLLVATGAGAADISVLGSAAMKEVVTSVVPAFEKATGHRVKLAWAGTEAITKRVAEGEVVDVVLIAAPNIDKLTAQGKIVQGSRADVARSGIGIAVRAGAPRPDVSSGEAVKKAVLSAGSVAYSSGPSGFYVAELFQRMGIADAIKAKVKQTPSGVLVGDVVARGEAELGFQQISELLHLSGIQYLGPLPPEVQHFTVFSAGLHTASPAPEPAKAFMNALTSPDAAPTIRKAGMEPG